MKQAIQRTRYYWLQNPDNQQDEKGKEFFRLLEQSIDGFFDFPEDANPFLNPDLPRLLSDETELIGHVAVKFEEAYGEDYCSVCEVACPVIVLQFRLWYWTALTTDSPESNQAWRAFQVVSLETLKGSLAELTQTNRELQTLIEDKLSRLTNTDTTERDDLDETVILKALERTEISLVERIGLRLNEANDEVLLELRLIRRDMVRILASPIDSGTREIVHTRTFSIDEHRSTPSEIARIRKSYVKPSNYQKLTRDLRTTGIHWLIGPAGVGKRTFALFYALENGFDAKNIIMVEPQSEWRPIVDAFVQQSGCAIVLCDAFANRMPERREVEAMLRELGRIDEENLIIVTTTDDILLSEDIRSPTLDIIQSDANAVFFDFDTYGYSEIEHIVRRRITDAPMSDDVRNKIGDLLKTSRSRNSGAGKFQRLLGQWLPGDIEVFVESLQHSSAAGISSKVDAALRSGGSAFNASIQDKFDNLTSTARCFVAAVALTPGSNLHGVWSNSYQALVRATREDFEPGLPIQAVYSLVSTTREFLERIAGETPDEDEITFVNPRTYSTLWFGRS